MVTTTTPLAANEVPLYQALRPDPPVKPPPWIHTRTGRDSASTPGVYTLRVRQPASLISGCSAVAKKDSWLGPCGAIGPKRSAGLTPLHGSGGRGGRQRRSPTGGAANGMPRNCSTPDLSIPSTVPSRVSTSVMALLPGCPPRRHQERTGGGPRLDARW